jgi:hypothetical protein
MPQVFLGEAFSVPGNNEHATGAGVSQSCTSAGSFPQKKKQVVELESPGWHWSDWPVLELLFQLWFKKRPRVPKFRRLKFCLKISFSINKTSLMLGFKLQAFFFGCVCSHLR